MNLQTHNPEKSGGICVAGTHSGCGKTTVALGIMSALVRRGYVVQPFKVGPDFIDPGHHRRITGRDSHNLDGWMMDQQTNRDVFDRYSRDAEVAVVEGVMGLFDGFSGRDEAGSTAQMAKWLALPTLIVIDARSMARSAAAVALGFSTFDAGLCLKGVIFNRVAGQGHGEMIQDAMSEFTDIPVIGCLPRQDDIEIPSRHLGLVTDEDLQANDRRFESLGQWIEDHLDLDSFIEPGAVVHEEDIIGFPGKDVRIGIAEDEAFCFYYPENKRLLRMAGADLVSFSPLRSKHLPKDVNGLYLGGGYPELHCKALSRNTSLLREIKDFGLSGRPIYAECGGFMYLMDGIRDFDGINHPMVGIFPMMSQMEKRLMRLGYREVEIRGESPLGPVGTIIRGHEFHYSRIREQGEGVNSIYSIMDRKGNMKEQEGYLRYHVLGSYVHQHWGSNSKVAKHFVDYCRSFGNS